MQRSDDLTNITGYVYGVWSISGGQSRTLPSAIAWFQRTYVRLHPSG